MSSNSKNSTNQEKQEGGDKSPKINLGKTVHKKDYDEIMRKAYKQVDGGVTAGLKAENGLKRFGA